MVDGSAETKNDHRKSLADTINEHLPNPTEIIIDQIMRMFIEWYNRFVLIVFGAITILIPVYMLGLGVAFFPSCPRSLYLRLHMIVCDSASLVAALLLINVSVLWKKAINGSLHMTCYKAAWLKMLLSLVDIIVMLVCLLGLILLTVELVRISSTVEFVELLLSDAVLLLVRATLASLHDV
jgi:hypothetical protein